jgi:hypothetical protein
VKEELQGNITQSYAMPRNDFTINNDYDLENSNENYKDMHEFEKQGKNSNQAINYKIINSNSTIALILGRRV